VRTRPVLFVAGPYGKPGKPPSTGLRLAQSFFRPSPLDVLHDECSLTNRVLDCSHLPGLGLSESNWFSFLAHGGGYSQLTVRGRRTGAGRIAQERMGGRYRGTVRLCEGVRRGCARRTSSQDRRFYEVA